MADCLQVFQRWQSQIDISVPRKWIAVGKHILNDIRDRWHVQPESLTLIEQSSSSWDKAKLDGNSYTMFSSWRSNQHFQFAFIAKGK